MSVIYVDVLFFTNMTFDLLSLYLVSVFTKSRLYPLRCIVASILASLSGIWLMLSCRHLVLFSIVSIFTLVGMVYFSFGPRNVKESIKMSLLLLFMLFISGALMDYLLRQAIKRFGVIDAINGNGKALVFVGISLITGGLLVLSSKMMKKETHRQFVTVGVEIDKRREEGVCIADSGNLVKDPVGGLSVVFLPPAIAYKLLSYVDAHILAKSEIAKMDVCSDRVKTRMHLVPCHTIHGNSILMCIRPDVIDVDGVSKNALVTFILAQEQEYGICPAELVS